MKSAFHTRSRFEIAVQLTRDRAEAFAHEWATAWNDRDLERVLRYFSEDVSFTSPTALAVTGAATVRGKIALRAYWAKALAQISSLKFSIKRVLWDESTSELAIIYKSDINGKVKQVSENLKFDASGLVVNAEVFHGVIAE